MSMQSLIEIRDEVWAAGYAARIDEQRGQVVVSCPGLRLVGGEPPQPCVSESRVSSMRAAQRLINSMS